MIKILHLYYDLLNLYGENANVRALVKSLEEQEVKVRVDFKSLEDDINILDYDFIYVGSGSYESLTLAKDNIKKLSKDIKKFIDDNKYILSTGNSIELFDNILNYKSKRVDFRIVGEQVYTFDNIDKLIIGFQNRDSVIYDVKETPLFQVKEGTGYEPNILSEGIKHNNFYGTYLLGPILVRNPYFLEYIVKNLLESKNIKYKKIKEGISYTAYEEFIKNFVLNK
ncbi:MAG: hypothetical protein IJ572_05525 [Bacilli bacterium]|nr:hypothetical protein [Bacilli bacterium]